jgi:hypothetical protein
MVEMSIAVTALSKRGLIGSQLKEMDSAQLNTADEDATIQYITCEDVVFSSER